MDFTDDTEWEKMKMKMKKSHCLRHDRDRARRAHAPQSLKSMALSTVLLGAAVVASAAAPETNLSAVASRPAPEWMAHGVMYQIWLRSFTPEGTLKAATVRLKDVADLGATIVYLCPVQLADDDMRREFWSTRQKASGTNNPRNPYRIKEYNAIDPEYGTGADLRAFVAEAHRLGLRVLMDMVYFHCGPTSPLLDRPGFVKRTPEGTPFTGNWNFPVLDFSSDGLREHLWANMEKWVNEFNVDGFRCDVSDAVPLDFWTTARDRLEKIRPDVGILAEGQRKDDQVRAFDANYNFTWYNAVRAVFEKGEPASSLRALWEKQRAERPRGARFIRYTENHDLVNDYLRCDVVMGERGADAMAAVHFTLDGVPFVYNGQEIGDTSPQSIYAKWAVRWEAACLPKAKARLDFYKSLCSLRRAEPAALAGGEVVWLDNDRPEAVLSFLRRGGGREILTVANLSNRKVEAVVQIPAAASGAWEPAMPGGVRGATAQGGLGFAFNGCGWSIQRR